MCELTDASFRANPSYELVLLDRLAPSELERVRELEEVDELYGLLRPRPGSQLELRAASRDTALLLFTLRDPGPLPNYIRTDLGGELGSVVARLVLDGVLEIDHGGSFLSGAEARDFVLAPARERERGRIAVLSVEALQYGQALAGMSVQQLAQRLYFYGRRPVSPAWQRRLPSEEAVRQYLGLGGRGRAQTVLDASWVEGPNSVNQSYWRMWRPRQEASARIGAGYKLYVSPDCAALPDALLAVAEVLAYAPGARGFKVGRDVYGLCRPDKLVAYFSRLEDLHAAASQLRDRLTGIPSHGVPFTAEATRDGLLSWGIDPPRDPRFAGAQARGSWRLWLVDRLAEYLLNAGLAGDSATEPWQFALDRVHVDGVDTGTWVPTSRIWSRSMATN